MPKPRNINLTNRELIQELEKRIKAKQIILEICPDSVKECPWSDWKSQFFLKDQDYSLNLTELFEELQKKQSKHCSCCSKNLFTTFFKTKHH